MVSGYPLTSKELDTPGPGGPGIYIYIYHPRIERSVRVDGIIYYIYIQDGIKYMALNMYMQVHGSGLRFPTLEWGVLEPGENRDEFLRCS